MELIIKKVYLAFNMEPLQKDSDLNVLGRWIAVYPRNVYMNENSLPLLIN